ncbi:MAG: hypothetical protein KAT43_03530 [Nanoarchaeota archaeon]|nr:hypothetical protein [Nanoarchaeota archaeon]
MDYEKLLRRISYYGYGLLIAWILYLVIVLIYVIADVDAPITAFFLVAFISLVGFFGAFSLRFPDFLIGLLSILFWISFILIITCFVICKRNPKYSMFKKRFRSLLYYFLIVIIATIICAFMFASYT